VEDVPVLLQGNRRTGHLWPLGLRSDGLFSSQMSRFTSSREASHREIDPQDTVMVPRVLFNASGEVVDTIGWDPYPPPGEDRQWVEAGQTRYYVPRPPQDDPLSVDLAEDRWIIQRSVATSGDSGFFRITRISGVADTVFTRSYRYSPQPYPPEVMDSMAWQSARAPGGIRAVDGRPLPTPEGVNAGRVYEAIRDAMDFPEFQPPIQEGIGGDDGTLWLRREDMCAETCRWLLIGPDGSPQGHLQIPCGWRVPWISSTAALAIEHDELDVPWILRLRIDSWDPSFG